MKIIDSNHPARHLVVAGLCALLCMASTAAPARRNVLFMVADDLNCYLGAYGNTQVKSPHIDRLAEQGTLFTRAYSQFPVCGPSRSSFMTGLRPNTTGILSNGPSLFEKDPDVKTIASEFKRQGYVTARVGKIYNAADNSEKREWDHLLNAPANMKQAREAEGESINAGHRHWNAEWRAPDCDDGDLPDGAAAKAAVEWIGKNGEKPFFLAVGFKKPHQPLISPKKYYDLYDREKLRKAWTDYLNEDVPDAARNTSGRKLEAVITEEQRMNYNRAYYAAVSYIDAQVGRLVTALEENGLAGNTVIVLFSDHGFHVGEHRTWGKNMVFESASRVPLIITGPGAEKGLRCGDVVELVDLFPTLTELCGLEAVSGLEGRSLAALLKGGEVKPHPGFTQVVNGWAVRTPQWRLMNYDPENKGMLLYDLQQDPLELKNLADDPGQEKQIEQLLEQGRAIGLK